MDPVSIVLLGGVGYLGFLLWQKGSGQGSVIVRPTVSVSAPSSGGTPPAASSPAGAADQVTVPINPTGSVTPVAETPKAQAPAPSLTKPIDTLAWIFQNGNDALRAGYGQVFKNEKGGLSLTGPHGAISLANPGVIYGSESEALKAGMGNFFQKGGDYYVTGPNAATKVSDRFQPHVASADLSAYGAVKGVIRGWTAVADRAGNLSFVPAHTVPGSTYWGDAQGDAPGKAEWDALAGKL